MTQIADDLKQLSDSASFTRTDMAAWCDFDKSAMREWMVNGVTPHPVRLKHIEARLHLLRWALKNLDMLPVPVTIKQYARVQYVKKVLVHALKEFSKSGVAKRGV